MTLATQIDKLKERFGLSRVVLVGDRGMITSARIRDELKPAGLDWITALRAPQIRALLDTGAFQLSLFDERDLAEITAPEFPGERLVVCKNPLLAGGRASARICCRPPKRHWPSWPTRSPAALAPKEETRSRAPSAASKTAISSPSCLTSASPKTASASLATPRASLLRPGSMVFTSSAPASRGKRWRPSALSVPTRTF